VQSRVPMRLFTLVAAVVVGFVGFLPSPSALAADYELPFEPVFPQEIGPTEFRDTYGQSRSGGRSHNGTDLLAPRMTEIYALADGTVTYVGTNNLSGRNIKLDHGEGWESYYVHLNNDNVGTDDGAAPWSLAVPPDIDEGVEVVAGQLIGWVGDSGNAEGTTPHTHFELRKDGKPINAYEILLAAHDRTIELEIESRLDTTAYEVE
jgi:murein DD-endopeptidase MepM/ murein hydrolase activator NlpD